jgi:hypothetical protein
MERLKIKTTEDNMRMDKYVDIYRDKWMKNNIILARHPYEFWVEPHDTNHNTVKGRAKCLICGYEWKKAYYKTDEPICPNCHSLTRMPLSSFPSIDITILNNYQIKEDIASNGEDLIAASIIQNTNLILEKENNGDKNSCIPNFKLTWNDTSVDFYLPYYKIAIEVQGEQHFFPTNMKNKKYITTDSLETIFLKQIIRDMFKHDMLNGQICYLIHETVPQYNFKDFLDNFLKNTQEILTKMDKETFKYCICDGKRRGYLKNDIQKKQNEWIEYIISKLKNMYKKIYCYPNDLVENLYNYIKKGS